LSSAGIEVIMCTLWYFPSMDLICQTPPLSLPYEGLINILFLLFGSDYIGLECSDTFFSGHNNARLANF